jgi:hypothetical protein
MSTTIDCLRVLAWLVCWICRRLWGVGRSFWADRKIEDCAALPKGYAGDALAALKTQRTCHVSPRVACKVPERAYGRGFTTCNIMRGSLSALPTGGSGRGRGYVLWLALGRGTGAVGA